MNLTNKVSLIGAASAALIGFGVAACAQIPGASEATPLTITQGEHAPTVNNATLSPPSQRTRQEQTYLDFLQSEGIQVQHREEQFIHLAITICDAAADGVNGAAIGLEVINGGYSGTAAGSILGGALNAFCPDYWERVMADVNRATR